VSNLHNNPQYYCSICLIIRDESEYLKEWIDWHIGQGVEHFYIYDHDSKEPITEWIERMTPELAEKITVIDWSGAHDNAQPDAYNHCLAWYGNESRWIGFIDADEHVRVKTGQALPEFLKGYERYAGLFMVWTIYGACGQKEKSNLPLRQQFPTPTPIRTWSDKMGKVFVQPRFMRAMYIHNGYPKKGCDVVGEYKDILPEAEFSKENATTNLICVDHYFTKSYEEWLEKLKRGRCHASNTRKYDEFFEFNPDMEYCREDIDPPQIYEFSTKKKSEVSKKSDSPYKYECSICLIIRDENEYLREWLEWHIALGVGHFYIYDHGSKQSVAELVQSLGSGIADKVDVIDWSGPHRNAQPEAYNDCLKRFGPESKWIGFIDVDEFVNLRIKESLPEFLQNYEEFAGLFIAWVIHNANGQKYKSGLPVRERFKTPMYETVSDGMGKVFVQPQFMQDIYIHNGRPVTGKTVVGELKDLVPDNSFIKEYPTVSLIYIEHYFTKSYEEWIEKLNRGRCHLYHGRKYDEFFVYNPDMEKECREEISPIQKYEISTKVMQEKER